METVRRSIDEERAELSSQDRMEFYKGGQLVHSVPWQDKRLDLALPDVKTILWGYPNKLVLRKYDRKTEKFSLPDDDEFPYEFKNFVFDSSMYKSASICVCKFS